MNKLGSKLQNSWKAGLKSQTRKQKTTKTKIWKIMAAKFKCRREHVLVQDWLIKVTRNQTRGQNSYLSERGELRVRQVQNTYNSLSYYTGLTENGFSGPTSIQSFRETDPRMYTSGVHVRLQRLLAQSKVTEKLGWINSAHEKGNGRTNSW